MKRLILMGGRPWESKDNGQYFSEVLFRYFSDNVQLAFCLFAQPESDWSATMERNKKMFERFKGNLTIDYRIMGKDNFVEVSDWADIVYIPGGNPFILKDTLESCGEILQLWDGKVIAGSSAGADLFCEQFAYLQDKSFGRGLGWIPVSCLPHWRDAFEDYTQKDWDWAEQESLQRFPNLSILTIPEGDFVEFTVK